MPCACASSVMACRLFSIMVSVDGPVLPAISLVPAKTQESGRFEGNHIREHAHQHLGSGLSADAAVHVGLVREILRQFPTVGDGVTEEDDAARIGRQLLEFLVVGVVAAELIPVLELVGEALGGGRKATVGSRRSELVD